MKNVIYGRIIEKEGLHYLDYGGDYLLPYDGNQTDGIASYAFDVTEQTWESIFKKAQGEKKNLGLLEILMQLPSFEVKLVEGADPNLKYHPNQYLGGMSLEYPGSDIRFTLRSPLSGDLLAKLYNGENISVSIVDTFDTNYYNPLCPVPVRVLKAESSIPPINQAVIMYVHQWTPNEVRVSVRGCSGWIPSNCFPDWEEKIESGFFYQGKELWVRRQGNKGNYGFLFLPSNGNHGRRTNGADISKLIVSPGMQLDDVTISYIDWRKNRLMINYEGFDIPVDVSNIPYWNQRRDNLYRYMEGTPVSVKVLKWGSSAEDCLVQLLSINVTYPFKEGEILEGFLSRIPNHSESIFTILRHSRQFTLTLLESCFSGPQIPIKEWLSATEIKVRVIVESITEHGDPILSFSSLMNQYEIAIPYDTEFQVQVIGWQENRILWRIGHYLSSTIVLADDRDRFEIGSFISMKRTHDGIVLVGINDEKQTPSDENMRKVPSVTAAEESTPGDNSPEANTVPPAEGTLVKARVTRTSKKAVYLRYGRWDGYIDCEHWQWTHVYSLDGIVHENELLDVIVLPSVNGDSQLRFGRKEILNQPTLRRKVGDKVKVRVSRVGQHVLCVSLDGVDIQIDPSQACWIPEYALDGVDLRTEFKEGQELDAQVISSGAHSADLRLSLRPFLINPWDYIPLGDDEVFEGIVFSSYPNGFSVRIHFYYGWVPNPGFNLAPGTHVLVRRRHLDRNNGCLELEFIDVSFGLSSSPVREENLYCHFPFHIGDDVQLRIRTVFSPEVGSGPYDSLQVETLDEFAFKGLIPGKELAWRSVERRASVYRPGQIITARIIALDSTKGVFKASIRDLVPDTRTLDEIHVGEKLDVRIISFKNYNIKAQYRDYQGVIEINTFFWTTLNAKAFFLVNHYLEVTVKEIDAQKGIIIFHLPEYEDVHCWEKLSLNPGDCIKTKIVRVGPEWVYVRYQQVLIPMNWRRLSWTNHIQLSEQFFEDDVLDVRVVSCEPRSRMMVLDARSFFNPFDSTVGFQEGMLVSAKVVRMIPSGIFVMVGPTACFLPKEELPEAVTVLPEFNGNETLRLTVLKMDEQEGTILLSAKNVADNPLLRSFKEGTYERFTVTGYDSKGIQLHVGHYRAYLASEDALLGRYQKEEIYPIGNSVLLQIVSAKGTQLKVTASFLPVKSDLPEGSFEAECCFKAPDKGLFLRYHDSFFVLPSSEFSQPFEQMMLIKETTLGVHCSNTWQDDLPCVALNKPLPLAVISEDMVGHVLTARCIERIGERVLLESKGVYLLMNSSDENTPLKAGCISKVRVLFYDTELKRVVVSARAVKNDPLQSLSIGAFYDGQVLNGTHGPVFRANLPDNSSIQGDFVADPEEYKGMTNLRATPIAIFHDDPGRKMKRRIVFDLAIPKPPRPAVGLKVNCTIIGKDNQHRTIDAQFSFKGQAYTGRLPMKDSFWYGFKTPLPKKFRAVIMGLPQKEGGLYDLSVKHSTINPFYCCEIGEVITAEVMAPMNDGLLVRYMNAIAYMPKTEMSHQVVDIPKQKWRRLNTTKVKILLIHLPENPEDRIQFNVSAKAAVENPFEGENALKTGDVYPAIVDRVDNEGKLVVVRLEGKEAEATITDTTVFFNGFKSSLPNIGAKIQRVVITDIRDKDSLPHVFAQVVKL